MTANFDHRYLTCANTASFSRPFYHFSVFSNGTAMGDSRAGSPVKSEKRTRDDYSVSSDSDSNFGGPHPTTVFSVNEGDADPEALLDDPAVYKMRKRAPLRGHGGAADVYVTRNARFGSLVARCLRSLRARRHVRLHSLGAALQRCADVALAVQNKAGADAVVIAPITGTVFVVDDYEPLVPGYPAQTRQRAKNALHVTITATDRFIG